MKKYNLEATGNTEIIGIHDAVTLQPLATIKLKKWFEFGKLKFWYCLGFGA